MRTRDKCLIATAIAGLCGLLYCLVPTDRVRIPVAGSGDGNPEIAPAQAVAPANSATVDAASTRSTVDNEPTSTGQATAEPQSAPETQAQFNRRALESALDQFDGKEVKTLGWPGLSRQQLVPIVVSSSVAAVMDAMGTSRPTPNDGLAHDIFEADRYAYAFTLNNKDYRFGKGEFPIYERCQSLTEAASERQRAMDAARLKSSNPMPKLSEELAYPDDFLELVSQFAHGALGLTQK